MERGKLAKSERRRQPKGWRILRGAVVLTESLVALSTPAVAAAMPQPSVDTSKNMQHSGFSYKERGTRLTGRHLLGLKQSVVLVDLEYGNNPQPPLQAVETQYQDTITNTGRLPLNVKFALQPDADQAITSVTVPGTWYRRTAHSPRLTKPATVYDYSPYGEGRKQTLQGVTEPLVRGESITLGITGSIGEPPVTADSQITQTDSLSIDVTGKTLPIPGFTGHAFSNATQSMQITYNALPPSN